MINHIAIIMDGNRRWAKSRALQPWKGHEEGRNTIETVLKFCQEKTIFEITLYTFSIQNFKRDQKEVDFLMKLLHKTFISKHYLDQLHAAEVQVKFIGRTQMFAQHIQEVFSQVEEDTAKYTKHKLNICVGYGGREEIVDATKKLMEQAVAGTIKAEDLTEEQFGQALYLNSNPELIIRTSGEHRTSNFLPWQSTYSEWFFIKENWPEVTHNILETIFEEYTQRERRYGK
jgi:tritrans,polycis-undecaprenyl-diphosphate synthase [geranylgeranyl-diphosphate specific]